MEQQTNRDRRLKDSTIIAHAGRDPEAHSGAVNPPVYHASTITFPSISAMNKARQDRFNNVTYGRIGTPTSYALEDAVAELEGGDRSIALPSGLAAIAAAITAFAKSGDHILMVDNVYGPARKFCDQFLTGYGVSVTYFDPHLTAELEPLIQENTRLVYLESPGSQTFEMQDVPAISALAHRRGLTVLMDNTWGTPCFFKSFEKGVDVSIHAATKYIGGHSDLMLGLVVAKEDHYRTVKSNAMLLGLCAGPDDCFLALRGLRTIEARLRMHQAHALEVANWLTGHPLVEQVLYPALPGADGHRLWKRDFLGACGLFSVVLRPCSEAAVAAMVDGLRFFGLGASWGGFESLVLPMHPEDLRSATRWEPLGPVLRFHIGLEDPRDLIHDLECGFDRLRAVQQAVPA
ncbi:cystathionine beta-lyase [Pelagibius sp. CAU 1746]|uniref:cystathionine beta-lyase n=1 Tax=Pelagibius sp. CAU 1746 TaxID=3140370 RepID=UPI00325A4949